MAQKPRGPRNLDNPNVEPVFADSCIMVMSVNRVVYLTLTSRKTDPARIPEFHNVVSSRLVLTVNAAVDLYKQLDGAMVQLEKDGVIVRQRGQHPTIQ